SWPARNSRRTMFEPMRPRPIIPSCIDPPAPYLVRQRSLVGVAPFEYIAVGDERVPNMRRLRTRGIFELARQYPDSVQPFYFTLARVPAAETRDRRQIHDAVVKVHCERCEFAVDDTVDRIRRVLRSTALLRDEATEYASVDLLVDQKDRT